ncbi:MAG: hypothetical protein AAFY56_16865 [Pseudomonadota bacterium]
MRLQTTILDTLKYVGAVSVAGTIGAILVTAVMVIGAFFVSPI